MLHTLSSLRRHYPYQVLKGIISAHNSEHPLTSTWLKSAAKVLLIIGINKKTLYYLQVPIFIRTFAPVQRNERLHEGLSFSF